MSKDTDVKAYIFHPITKRWEGLVWSMFYLSSSNPIVSSGVYSFSTSEGLIIISGDYEVIDGQSMVNQNSSYTHMCKNDLVPSYKSGEVLLLVSYNGNTKKI